MNSLRPRRLSEAELKAFDTTCERLAGFDDALSFEAVDGRLCALAAGPLQIAPQDWLPVLFGDAFERAFADPEDQAQALRSLQARLAVLYSELDPEALFADPDALRLEPLVADWNDAERQRLIDEDGISAEDAASLQTGMDWVAGFLEGVEALPTLWKMPPDEEAAAAFEQAFKHLHATLLPPGSDELKAHIAEFYPADEAQGLPTRDDLLAEACMAVQDLRMHWVDFAPKPQTRRVETQPGRNDPCPCGSGKKYKKCHGAAAP